MTRVLTIAALLLGLSVGACDKGPLAPHCPNDKDLENAALFNLGKQLDFSLYHDPAVTQEKIDRQEINVAGLRRWVETIPDACTRRAYLDHIEIAENGAEEAKENLRDPSRLKRNEPSSDAKWLDRVRKLQGEIAKPPICLDKFDREGCLP